MPIYEYRCSNCEHQFEAIQKFSDAPLADCPACHNPALKKLVSAASFRLKGGGWYETDFKKEGRKQLAESDSAAASSEKAATPVPAETKEKPSAPASDSTPAKRKKTETASSKASADTAKN